MGNVNEFVAQNRFAKPRGLQKQQDRLAEGSFSHPREPVLKEGLQGDDGRVGGQQGREDGVRQRGKRQLGRVQDRRRQQRQMRWGDESRVAPGAKPWSYW